MGGGTGTRVFPEEVKGKGTIAMAVAVLFIYLEEGLGILFKELLKGVSF